MQETFLARFPVLCGRKADSCNITKILSLCVIAITTATITSSLKINILLVNYQQIPAQPNLRSGDTSILQGTLALVLRVSSEKRVSPYFEAS